MVDASKRELTEFDLDCKGGLAKMIFSKVYL